MLRSKLFLMTLGLLLGFPAMVQAQPLQVYILAGQSNMQGHAQVRTFDHLAMDEQSKVLLDEMRNSDGTPRVCNRVWISSLGSAEQERSGKLTAGFGASQNGPKIGPEFTFGLFIEKYVPGRILIIKTAWGGKSLHTDFRSPSAGAYQFTESQRSAAAKRGEDFSKIEAAKAEATGVYYRLMIEHVQKVLGHIDQIIPDYDSKEGYDLAGFVWFQGWNDMVDGSTYSNRDKAEGYAIYSDLLAHFIRDVRRDLNAPKLPFVIGVMGVNGPVKDYNEEQKRYVAIHQNFRLAMAAPADLPEFKGNVSALWTEQFWDQELSRAKQHEEKIKQAAKRQAKEEKLSNEEEKRLVEKMLSEGLTARERGVIEKGISNLEFHYLGSAKILGAIGKGMAESMAELKGISKESDKP